MLTKPETTGYASTDDSQPSSTWRTPLRAPDLAELETLVACAAEGSMSAAAGSLGISRPAVAKRIGNFEALAGVPLLHRSGRGVTLTDAGATVLAGARRMLIERDLLVSVLTEIRWQGPSAIGGLRELLRGGSDDAPRSGQLIETRLADTERVLELVLRSSSSGVVISEPEADVVHEVNEAFCRFAGRTREELLSSPISTAADWYHGSERGRLLEDVRRTGMAENVVVRMHRPDRTVATGTATAYFVTLGGRRLVLSIVEATTGRPD